MKAWYASKTLWFNVLALAVVVASGFGFGGFQPAPEVEMAATVIITVVNLILRFYTRQGVGRPSQ